VCRFIENSVLKSRVCTRIQPQEFTFGGPAMIEEQEENVVGVVCLRCGILTPLQISTHWRTSMGVHQEFHSPVAIVRCHGCGKESSYLPSEVVAFKTMTNTLHATA
jgi:hypothetical protein